MQTLKEIIIGEVVMATIYRNVFGEFICVIGIQIKRYETLAEASALVDDYMAMSYSEAA